MSRFGAMIGGKKTSESKPAPVVETVMEEPALEEVVEEPTAEVEEEVELIPYESDLSLHDMTKEELEEYGRTIGIELDRRHSKKRLIQELEEFLSTDL